MTDMSEQITPGCYNKYAVVDAAIVKAVAADCSTPLYSRDVRLAASALCDQSRTERVTASRIIDRRLQALRKRGTIVYLHKAEAPAHRTGWYLALWAHSTLSKVSGNG